MAKKNVLIIGAGGVAQVTAHKVAQWAAEFGDLHIANRTQAKADAIIQSLREKGHDMAWTSHALDAMDADAVEALDPAGGCGHRHQRGHGLHQHDRP